MISVYALQEKVLQTQTLDETPLKGSRSWINLVGPTHNEIQDLSAHFGLWIETIAAALDPDERARFEVEEGVMLILLRLPIVNDDPDSDIPYITRPLGIILVNDVVITVCSKENSVIRDFIERKVKHFDPANRFNFVLQIFFRASLKYQRYLKEIDLQVNDIEYELQRSLKNEELLRLLNKEKSLIYFTTSLRTNQVMLERLRRSGFARALNEEDEELLEEIIIDNQQAIEQAHIQTNILNGIMSTLGSVISNNVNNVMKRLTQITIMLMIPTLITSIYGMNVQLPLQDSPVAFAIIVVLCVVAGGVGFAAFTLPKRGSKG